MSAEEASCPYTPLDVPEWDYTGLTTLKDRQVTAIRYIIRRFALLGQCVREITTLADDSDKTRIVEQAGTEWSSPKAAERYILFGMEHGWTISDANWKDVLPAAEHQVRFIQDTNNDPQWDLLTRLDNRLSEEDKAQRKADHEKYMAQVEKARKAVETIAAFRDRHYPDCKGVVIARMITNTSESLTGYYGHSAGDPHVLGFVKSTRKLFSNMRKFCNDKLDFPDMPEEELQRLINMGDPKKSKELRESGGNELKERVFYDAGDCGSTDVTHHHSSGWEVTIDTINNLSCRGAVLGLHLPADPDLNPDGVDPAKKCKAKKPKKAPAKEWQISEAQTKRGKPILVLTVNKQFTAEQHQEQVDWAMDRRGWYYARSVRGNPVGFAFRVEEDAQEKINVFIRKFLSE